MVCSISFSQDAIVKRKAAYDAEIKRSAEKDILSIKDEKLEINIRSEKSKYSGGEPIKLDITLKNNGKSQIELSRVQVERFFNIEVLGPDSTQVPLLASRFIHQRITGSGPIPRLNPQESKSATVWLSNIFDMSEEGPYKIKVTKKCLLSDGKMTPLTISSATVAIEITSALPRSEWHNLDY